MVGASKSKRHMVRSAIPQNMVGADKNERHLARSAIAQKALRFSEKGGGFPFTHFVRDGKRGGGEAARGERKTERCMRDTACGK